MKSRYFLPIIATVVFAACGSDKGPGWITGAAQSHKWGYYSGNPVTRWESDGRSMTLLSELRYTDPKGVVWIAPVGSKVDGASIPRSLWTFMGGPFEGRYRNASVLHDVAYDQRTRTWQECDRMYYNAMRCSGVSALEAKTMFYSLYRFGRHGVFAKEKKKEAKPSETVAQTEQLPRAIPVSAAEIDATRDWIRGNDPSLEEIEARASEAR